MRKNFLTTGAVIALAWVSLAPLSLLFMTSVVTSAYAMPIKGGLLLLLLFSWIFLSMGMGVFWRKETGDRKVLLEKVEPKGTFLSLEMLQTMKETEFSALCIRIFEKMWPEVTVEEGGLFHLRQKRYLVCCENRKTFFDSREIFSFEEEMKKKKAVGGYFFTTGIFSTASKNAASSSMIELIDGQKTIELMESFLNEKDLPPPHPPSFEKRRSPRATCEVFPLEDRPLLELGHLSRRAMKSKVPILNISNGGLCMESPNTEELPTFFQFSLKLPSHAESLHILGEVVWRRGQQGNRTKRCGISFVSMSDENRERLTSFLKKGLLIEKR